MASAESRYPLFPVQPILEWLPGETLFSLCSRYHLIAGHHVPAQTCIALFGSQRAGAAHDVPSYVQTLVDQTDGALGSAREIILGRTLIPFYFPFHPEHQCENWVTQMATGTSPGLKAQLGLAASQFGASHPLKACATCMHSDAVDYGVAYWHVEHQLPAVEICQLHRERLLIATDKVSGQDRFGWLLPRQARLHGLPDRPYCDSREHLFSEGGRALWALPPSFTFSQDRLRALYQAKLVDQGFVQTTSLRIHQKRFKQAVSDVLTTSSISLLWPWLSSEECVHNLSRRIVRMGHPISPRSSHHPLNHLLLIALLFDSWQHFLAAYDEQEAAPLRVSSATLTTREPLKRSRFDANDLRRSSLIEAIHSGKSVSFAAKLSGVTVATAMAWAALEGIGSPHRPKALSANLRARLIQQLRYGADKTAVASSAKISVESVTRMLMTEPGLHAQWVAARFKKTLKQSRNSWQKTRESLPSASSNDWRKLNSAVYAWLYRNDRAWLQSSIRNRPKQATTLAKRRDWQARDEALAQAIRVAALDWHVMNPGKRLTLGSLCSAVDGLRQKMSALSKLPLAQKAIQFATSAAQS